MQAVLLIILIGTVGLARVVSRYKVHALELKLAPAARFEDMSVSMPAGWEVELPRRAGADGPLVLRATEPGEGGAERVLTIVRDHTEVPQPPEEYLLTSGLMSPAYAVTLAGVGKLREPSSATVAGEAGYLVAGVRGIRTSSGQLIAKKEVFATAMLPSRDVITVRLEGLGRDLEDDIAAVRKIAAGITVPSPGEVVEGVVKLGGEGTVKSPAGFVQLPEPDGHLMERHLLRAAPPSRWCDVTVVPCVFFPDSDDVETFRTMLLSRDAEWLEARISSPGDGVLRAELPMRAGLPFPRRAYLRTSPGGNALLVEFHAGSAAEAGDWDEVFGKVVASATVPAGASPAELLKVGVAEVERLKGVGLPALLEGVPREQWWMWTSHGRPVGWTHLGFEVGDPSHGLIDNRIRTAGGGTVIVREAFETSPDLSRHNDSVLRRDFDATNKGVDRLKEETSLAGGKYTLALMPDPSSGKVARTVRVAPKGFVPGGWVPVLVGKLAEKEMIIRTARLPGLEAAALTAPVTIRVRPTTRPATYDVEVSGTGQFMTLSPEGMELSATVERRPTDPGEIRKAFPDDAALAPGGKGEEGGK